jgi:chemotaxis protein histidine kinase CheA
VAHRDDTATDLTRVVTSFVADGHQRLDEAYGALLEVEDNPQVTGAVARLETALRATASTCRLLGQTQVYGLPSATADLAAALRHGHVAYDAEIGGAILAGIDGIRRGLQRYAVTGQRDRTDHHDLLRRLARLAAGRVGER